MTWLAFLPALLEVLRNYTGVHADLASALLLSVTPDVLLAQASTIVDEKNIVIGEKDAEIQELKHTLTSVTKGFKKQISDLAGSTRRSSSVRRQRRPPAMRPRPSSTLACATPATSTRLQGTQSTV